MIPLMGKKVQRGDGGPSVKAKALWSEVLLPSLSHTGAPCPPGHQRSPPRTESFQGQGLRQTLLGSVWVSNCMSVTVLVTSLIQHLWGAVQRGVSVLLKLIPGPAGIFKTFFLILWVLKEPGKGDLEDVSSET